MRCEGSEASCLREGAGIWLCMVQASAVAPRAATELQALLVASIRS